MSKTLPTWLSIVLFSIILFSSSTSGAADRETVILPEQAMLAMTDVQGQSVVWPEQEEFRVFCFLGVECPVARFYAARLNELSKQFGNEHVTFLGINSNPHDSLTDLQKFEKELELNFRTNQGCGPVDRENLWSYPNRRGSRHRSKRGSSLSRSSR